MELSKLKEAGFYDVAIDPSLDLFAEIEKLKKEKKAIILAHYYQEGDIQDVADFLGDSLQLAQAAKKTSADVILFAGVHFMAETAKILNPDRVVVVPDMNAGCSLADGCPADRFRAWRDRHPGAAAISYINCSAGVKALSDCIVTSCTPDLQAGAALYQLEDAAKQAFAKVAAQQSVRVGTTDCGYDSVVFARGVKDAFSGHETVAPLTTDDNADRWINPVKIDTSFTGSIMAPFDASAHPKPAGYQAFATAARQALDNSGCTTHITPGLTGASQIATGGHDSCALVAGGTVKCWGHNSYRELGDGTTTDRWTPVSVVASREAGSPVNVSASRSGDNVNVSWSAPSSGADSYAIEAQYVTVLPYGPPVISAWTALSTTTSTSYAVLCPGQQCSVRVRSFNQYGGSDYVTVGPF